MDDNGLKISITKKTVFAKEVIRSLMMYVRSQKAGNRTDHEEKVRTCGHFMNLSHSNLAHKSQRCAKLSKH